MHLSPTSKLGYLSFKRSPGINRNSRALYPGPGFISSAIWPSMPKTHHKRFIRKIDWPTERHGNSFNIKSCLTRNIHNSVDNDTCTEANDCQYHDSQRFMSVGISMYKYQYINK